ncbi:DUF1361 domain-containing protein [Cohnella rhizosphaerae]|uniref:DUF1361 domain-containing protein n=1 Tax=Cohnella rhizosphaerae TaxID=1457232 RepID=A0A9X4QW40_9BACL|nr:DUF1361 domain-containing protein [Cohnella rhizosphaerae]MDG0813239.1 DUF1361 domain-containing protein [Cohnella rhizosphaerae]
MIRTQPRPSAEPLITPAFLILCGTSLLCLFMLVVREAQVGDARYRFLLWNLFLAWLPLLVSMAAAGADRALTKMPAARGGLLLVLGVGWLLLYPNAPYLTTDLIHLIMNPAYSWRQSTESLILWYDLIVFFLFAWCGLLLGYLSMRQFHRLVSGHLGNSAGWLFIVAVSFLGGFGVYLGRVIRLNSWDVVFSPFRLANSVIGGINSNGAILTILFGMLILIVYLSLYGLGMHRGYGRDGVAGDGAGRLS